MVFGDRPHRLLDRSGLGEHVEQPINLGANPTAEEGVIVDDHD